MKLDMELYHGPRYVAIEFRTNPKNKMAATADFVNVLLCPITPWIMHVSSPNLMCTSGINIRCRFYIFGAIMKNKMAARAKLYFFADSAFLNDITHFKRKPLEISS